MISGIIWYPDVLMHSIHKLARSGASTIVPSEKAPIRIHKQVIKSLQTLQRTEVLWSVQVERVLHLEDAARNTNSPDRRFKSELPHQRCKFGCILYPPVLHWYWACLLRSPFLKALCVLTAFMAGLVVWSELTFFQRRPVLSIFRNILNAAKHSYDFLIIEMLTMIVLCYLFYCTYSTILRIRFLNLYYWASHHQTNEHSLIFSGMLLNRSSIGFRFFPKTTTNPLALQLFGRQQIKTNTSEGEASFFILISDLLPRTLFNAVENDSSSIDQKRYTLYLDFSRKLFGGVVLDYSDQVAPSKIIKGNCLLNLYPEEFVKNSSASILNWRLFLENGIMWKQNLKGIRKALPVLQEVPKDSNKLDLLFL
uniref:Uncharacterized protein n=1 Tax=Glossina pallidipes TaxID=7398 RepID=A0A1A9Z4X6_GLOPL